MRPYRILEYRRIDDFRHIFEIGIFGSYYPLSQEELLRKVRNCLRSVGFTSAFLVKDFPDAYFEDERDKSYHFLHHADACFFIITREGEKMGVTSELEEYFREVKRAKAAVFEEVFISHGELISAASGMIRKILSSEKLRCEQFSDEGELLVGVESMAHKLFYEVYKEEKERLRRPSLVIKPLCEICGNKESEYKCLRRECGVYNICGDCITRDLMYLCKKCLSPMYRI